MDDWKSDGTIRINGIFKYVYKRDAGRERGSRFAMKWTATSFFPKSKNLSFPGFPGFHFPIILDPFFVGSLQGAEAKGGRKAGPGGTAAQALRGGRSQRSVGPSAARLFCLATNSWTVPAVRSQEKLFATAQAQAAKVGGIEAGFFYSQMLKRLLF